MDTFQRALLVGGLAAVLMTASASGAAFGSDTGNATIELDTTGLLDTDGGAGGGGGTGCTPSAEISVIGNGSFTQAGVSETDSLGNTFFEFNSGSFPVSWNPDTCGVGGGSLSLTGFKTEASVGENWIALLPGFIFNGLPARQLNSGVYNLDAVDLNNPNGTFHQVASNPIIATATANIGSTTTNVNITETLGLTTPTLPNYRYVTTATFSVLADQ